MILKFSALAVVALCALIALPTSGIAQNSFTEDFTTAAFKDTANTTAVWNTTDGELKLPPFVPTLAGAFDTQGEALAVAVDGDLAFVADFFTGLRIVDISDPTAPLLVGSYQPPESPRSIAVDGNLAFLACGLSGLQIVDITNPAAPSFAGSFDTAGFAYGVTVAGDRAFVADEASGLQIVDITDPTAPALVGSYVTPDVAFSVVVDGNLAFVATAGPLQIVDISDPAVPSLVASFGTDSVQGVAVDGDFAFLATSFSGLQIVDISDPAAPALVGSYDTPGSAYRVTVTGDRAYVADGDYGLQIVDISNPVAPFALVGYDTPGTARGLALAGAHVFVADQASGLQIVQINDPVVPSLVGSYQTLNQARSVTVAGNLAFVGDGTAGLQIVDISDPAAPNLIGSFDTPGIFAVEVVVAGDLAFVANDVDGIQIVDISDPALPTLVGSYDTPGVAHGIAVAGDRAFVADFGSGLQILDISNPAAPTLVGSYDTPGLAGDVVVAGDLAYVADYNFGLQIVDISNPAAPFLIANYPLSAQGEIRRVAVAGDLAFLANRFFGLQILDIANPAAPSLVGSYNLSNVLGVTVAGDLAFMADDGAGLQILDISDPAAPTLAASYDTPGRAFGTAVAGSYAFVADNESGVQIIQFTQDDYDPSPKTGQSLAVDGEDNAIVRARLETTQAAGVTWELSGDAGGNWTASPPAATWTSFAVPGTDLLWRSTHSGGLPANPAASSLTLEWLNEYGHIQSVTDIANDQGRQVSLAWQRSGYDFVGEPQQIVEYAVYRQIDPALKAADMVALPSGASTALQAHASSAKAAGWHFVTTVPVRAQDDYAVVVPTLADSTVAGGQSLSTFMVSALTATPGVFFDSPFASGYSVDNLAPGVPAALLAAFAPTEVVLDWDDSEDPDFQYYRIYRDTNPGFVPSAGNLVEQTAASGWSDPTSNPWNFYYKVTAVDFAGNESEAAEPMSVSGVDNGALPVRTALLAAYPNPFNPSTKLSFELAAPAHARLKIFDAAGRLVTTLVDEQRAMGRHEIVWNGQNSAGLSVASGVYLYRLEAGEVVQTKRMMLVK